MLREIIEPNQPTTGGALAEFESRFRVNLPDDYRRFLLRFNGGRPVPPTFRIAGLAENPQGVLQAFFGLEAAIKSEDMTEILTDLAGLIPDGVVPIGCTGCGDFLCLDLRHGKSLGRFWDRRSFWGTDHWSEGDLYEVADARAPPGGE